MSKVFQFGYWRDRPDDESDLPFPEPQEKPWAGREEFHNNLLTVELAAKRVHYKGPSGCRICGRSNGSAEHRYKLDGTTYVWPSGYAHYITQHNVKPPKEVQDFFKKAAAKIKDKHG